MIAASLECDAQQVLDVGSIEAGENGAQPLGRRPCVAIREVEAREQIAEPGIVGMLAAKRFDARARCFEIAGFDAQRDREVAQLDLMDRIRDLGELGQQLRRFVDATELPQEYQRSA